MEKLHLISAETLFYTPLDHPRMLIDGILSNGLAILSGDSKIGKSWMVLWFCLKISRGEPVWGLPTSKTDVIYLALEDKDWRIQQRMQDLIDVPPSNLHFGFSCGKLGAELEGQIKLALKEQPSTGLLFIDTLQMVRDNVSSKVNAYAQDYRDLSALKKIADDHNICIFLVHHNRKEHDGSNVFNDMTGSTGIAGVADTCMVLRKEDRFGNDAVLNITGRDIEEKRLKLTMRKNVWEVTEALDTSALRRERIPQFLFQIADYLLKEKSFTGTATELLAAIGHEATKANVASKLITRHFNEVFKPLGITMEHKPTAQARLMIWKLNDDDDGNDDKRRNETLASLRQQNDAAFSLPQTSSQSSFASWAVLTDPDDELPFQ